MNGEHAPAITIAIPMGVALVLAVAFSLVLALVCGVRIGLWITSTATTPHDDAGVTP